MRADSFLNIATGKIMVLGLFAFVLDTVAGLLFGKLMCFVTGGKINAGLPLLFRNSVFYRLHRALLGLVLSS